MSACNFNIPFSVDPEVVLEKAKRAVEKQSGNFTGDTNSGNFDVSFFGQKVAGTYTVNGAELNIVVDEKPFMVPCSAIESFLKSQLS